MYPEYIGLSTLELSNLQELRDLDFDDKLWTFEELGNASATAHTSFRGNHSKSENGDEIPNDEEQYISYLNETEFQPQSEGFEELFKEHHNNTSNMQLNVSTEAGFNTPQQQLSLDGLLLDHPQPLQQQVPTCEGEMFTSAVMNEMNNYSTRKKRKKSIVENGNKSSIHCNCKKSECLQRYCECFAMGLYCTDECGCTDCYNREIYEDTVWAARQRLRSKNPYVFAPQNVRGDGTSSSSARPVQGCKCKQSMCQKNYCECFQAGVSCTIACRCQDCHNSFGTRTDHEACSSGHTNNNIAQENMNTSHTTTADAQGLSSTRSTTLSTSTNNDRHTTPDASSTSNLTYAGNGHSSSAFLNPTVKYMYELLFGNNETPSSQPFGVGAENGIMLHNNYPNPTTSPTNNHPPVPFFVATPTNNHPPVPFPPYTNNTGLEAPLLASLEPQTRSTPYI